MIITTHYALRLPNDTWQDAGDTAHAALTRYQQGSRVYEPQMTDNGVRWVQVYRDTLHKRANAAQSRAFAVAAMAGRS